MKFFDNLKRRMKEDREFKKRLWLKNARYNRITIDDYKVSDIGFLKLFAIMILCLTLVIIVILWLYPYQTITFLKWYLNVRLGFSTITPSTVLK